MVTQSTPQRHSTLRIGMLLLPDFNSLSANAFIDPFRAANYVQGLAWFEWDFLSIENTEVVASNTLPVKSGHRFSKEDFYDFVVVNASFAPERFQNAPLKSWLRNQARQGTTLVGLDTGAFVLAFAGLMDGKQAVVHYEHTEAYRELFPDSDALHQLFVADQQCITCCGGLASADLALQIIRERLGFDVANAAAHYIFMDRLRPAEEDQLSRPHEPTGYSIPQLLREAILFMERNLEEPLGIAEISRHLQLSQRQLERLFQRYTKVSPKRYYLNLRLDRARSLITQTGLSLVEVAAICGFGSTNQLARAYKAKFNITPGKDRTEGRIPFQFRFAPRYSGL